MNGTGTRRVVVTGAASGIGAALAARLLADGQRVVGVDRHADGIPPGVGVALCDLADPVAVDATVARIRAAGPVDGVALVAGVPGTAPADVVHRVNVLGLRRFAEATVGAIPSGGAIVLVSSLAGYRGGATPDELADLLSLGDDDLAAALAARSPAGPAAYQLSKQLVHAYTVALAARLHPAGVRCVSVSPGPVATPILGDFRATMPTLEAATRLVGRDARPDEVAAVIAFALSPAASWLNGVDLRVDGGLTALRSDATLQSHS